MLPNYPYCPYQVTDPRFALLDSMPAADAWQRIKAAEPKYRRYIYKFREFREDFLHQILVESKLFLSSPPAFNDPFDMQVRLELRGTPQEQRAAYDKKVRERAPHLGGIKRRIQVDRWMADQDRLAVAAQQAYQTSRETIGVCSFASSPADIVMWSHYGDAHQGVCIQFEISRSPSRLLAAVPVKYTDSYPEVNFAADIGPQLAKTLFSKSKHWMYEGESRIVCINCANTYYTFRAQAVTGVIVGCRAGAEVFTFLRACNLARSRASEPVFRIYRAAPSATRYKLLIHPWRESEAGGG